MITIKPIQSMASLLVIATGLFHSQTAGAVGNYRPVPVNMNEQPPPWHGATAPTQQPRHAQARQARRPVAYNQAQRIQLAAQNGHPRAQYDLGLAYQLGQHGLPRDMRQAHNWFYRAARSGEPAAQYALSMLYRKGALGQPDLGKAMHWQHEAAKRGHSEAQYQLGLAHLNGHGGANMDASRGKFWLQQAAKRGHRSAQLALNRQQQAPRAVQPQLASIHNQRPMMPPAQPQPRYTPPPPQNFMAPAAAPMPSRMAPQYAIPQQARPQPRMQQPAPRATMPPPRPVVKRPPPAPSINPELAQRLRNTAENTGDRIDLQGMNPKDVMALADTGDRYAQFLVGAMYEDGVYGFNKSYREAARWYRRAAKQRYAKAQYNLALLYEDGKGVSQDYKMASQWYTAAADSGFTEAKNNLGVLYVLGKGVRRDSRKAEQLFSAAAQEGNPDAARNLQRLRAGR